MRFIETTVFTRRLKSLLTDENYRNLQNELLANPAVGKIIKGSGGIRKTRWAGSGRGKRGEVRVIYYWIREKEIILMLLIYTKKEQEDLTSAQLKILKDLVEVELK